ncbi:HNH endonuclease [Nostoc sp. WHI]|uniref:HNH endonuclease n=1 Tax=Nostoc sp. WHI TaxID=2650611 RepID=UPI0018C4B8D8|nr:HNH endonuclease [Nostoc sp. WHI]MBG1268379.1 hypothetical protein [Nostoc sp. WHI]
MPEFVYTTKAGKTKTAIFSEIDRDLIYRFKWRIGSDDYIRRNSPRDEQGKQKTIFFHKLVAERMGLDMSLIIHHFNSNRLDNRRENLKALTRQQIQMNRGKHCNNKSGFKGVVVYNKRGTKFRAQTTVNRQPIIIGYFDNAEDAYQAYCDYVAPIHGEFFKPA